MRAKGRVALCLGCGGQYFQHGGMFIMVAGLDAIVTKNQFEDLDEDVKQATIKEYPSDWNWQGMPIGICVNCHKVLVKDREMA